MLGAPVLSRSQLRYTVSSHSPRFCQAPSPFTHIQLNPDAHNVCTRAKNHYDPQMPEVRRLRLLNFDTVGSADSPDRAMARNDNEDVNEYRRWFQQAHVRQACRMYFL
jgi:hypothetical protein